MERVAFGDYGIQNPSPPADSGGPEMRRNVRYTIEGETLVARAVGPATQESDEQYVDLCRKVVTCGAFSGSTFSWGDGVIAEVAAATRKPKAQRMWRGAGTSHHMQFVTKQLEEASRSRL